MWLIRHFIICRARYRTLKDMLLRCKNVREDFRFEAEVPAQYRSRRVCQEIKEREGVSSLKLLSSKIKRNSQHCLFRAIRSSAGSRRGNPRDLLLRRCRCNSRLRYRDMLRMRYLRPPTFLNPHIQVRKTPLHVFITPLSVDGGRSISGSCCSRERLRDRGRMSLCQ
jgi:hypothetical protein